MPVSAQIVTALVLVAMSSLYFTLMAVWIASRGWAPRDPQPVAQPAEETYGAPPLKLAA